jgi:hypothetical protein
MSSCKWVDRRVCGFVGRGVVDGCSKVVFNRDRGVVGGVGFIVDEQKM